jgi:hypothetical protein
MQLTNVLIIEDDIEFVESFIDKLCSAAIELPEGWNALWVGGTDEVKPQPYSDKLTEVVKTWGGFAYIVNANWYDFLIELMSDPIMPCDSYYTNNQKYFSVFKVKEKLVRHVVGISDRAEKLVEYWHLL